MALNMQTMIGSDPFLQRSLTIHSCKSFSEAAREILQSKKHHCALCTPTECRNIQTTDSIDPGYCVCTNQLDIHYCLECLPGGKEQTTLEYYIGIIPIRGMYPYECCLGGNTSPSRRFFADTSYRNVQMI